MLRPPHNRDHKPHVMDHADHGGENPTVIPKLRYKSPHLHPPLLLSMVIDDQP